MNVWLGLTWKKKKKNIGEDGGETWLETNDLNNQAHFFCLSALLIANFFMA